ncbi:MAG: hypothetical protein KGZ86_08025 [Candidatus Latescibacteria bacterium]|nr:hypothetical protein [Candidatus Latescibacterota bacterium]
MDKGKNLKLPALFCKGWVVLLVVFIFSIAFSQIPRVVVSEPLSAPNGLKAYDKPNDGGSTIVLKWQIVPADTIAGNGFVGYEIFRAEHRDNDFENVGFALRGSGVYEDQTTIDGKDYYYYVSAVYPEGAAASDYIGPVQSKAQWFNLARLNVLIFTFLICFLIIWYIERAKKGEKLFIRKIAGLDAIDDAVGRATEMGRPILFSFGLSSITDVVAIAALSILSKIAKKSAEYQTKLLVPNYDPILMTAAQETVKQSYTEAGRPDLYNPTNMPFLTADQFGYAAGVDGIMLREKPGAVFWQGYFYAEALIMSETGHSIGAIQIAGTTAITQLPFFIASCDYTMIGEEMFAASCYLKPEPQMLGSLKGEDTAKAIILAIFVIIVIIGTAGALLHKSLPFLNTTFEYLYNWFIVQ